MVCEGLIVGENPTAGWQGTRARFFDAHAGARPPGRQVYTHACLDRFESISDVYGSGRYSSVRLKQAAEMRAFVAKKVCDGAPALMAGDFNVNGRASREDGHTDSKEYTDVWNILTDAEKGIV